MSKWLFSNVLSCCWDNSHWSLQTENPTWPVAVNWWSLMSTVPTPGWRTVKRKCSTADGSDFKSNQSFCICSLGSLGHRISIMIYYVLKYIPVLSTFVPWQLDFCRHFMVILHEKDWMSFICQGSLSLMSSASKGKTLQISCSENIFRLFESPSHCPSNEKPRTRPPACNTVFTFHADSWSFKNEKE